MTALLIEPHNDDIALFAAFTAIRHAPAALIVTVLRSVRQEDIGITAEVRERESGDAAVVLGAGWVQLPFPDNDPPWDKIRWRLEQYLEPELGITHVYAPAVVKDGHEHHNQIGELAGDVFGDLIAGRYLTYTPAGKDTNGIEVPIDDPAWVTAKLRALSCFQSQIETVAAGCTPHFTRGLTEYMQELA